MEPPAIHNLKTSQLGKFIMNQPCHSIMSPLVICLGSHTTTAENVIKRFNVLTT